MPAYRDAFGPPSTRPAGHHILDKTLFTEREKSPKRYEHRGQVRPYAFHDVR